MSEARPIVCTLTEADMADRAGVWRKLWSSGLLHRELVPNGIRLWAEPGGAEALMRMIELERECCAWIDYEVNGASSVTLTADGEGEEVLAGMFAPSS